MTNSQLARVLALAAVILIAIGIWYLSPNVLFQSSGNSAKIRDAKTFTTTGTWTVTYSYACSAAASYGNVNFAYFVMEPTGLASDTVALSDKSKTATVTYHTKGQHHLGILSYCPYSIKVKE